MEKVIEWIIKIITSLFPSVRRDPLAAILLGVSLAFDFLALSYWRYWNPSFNYLDAVGAVFLLFLVLRLWKKGWLSAPLLFVDALILVVLVFWFSFAVPLSRLSLSIAQAVISLTLAVRYSP